MSPAAIRQRIADLLDVDVRVVDSADENGLLWGLVGAELTAELRRHRARSLVADVAPRPAEAALERLVYAVSEVLGDRPFIAADLIAEGNGNSPHRVQLALATRALVGAAPGEDPAAQAVGRRLAAATNNGPRRFGDLALERWADHRSGAGRWRVADAADAAEP